jgi:hypothetical protein
LAAAGDAAAAKVSDDWDGARGEYRGLVADLHGDSARRVVLDGVAVVGDGVCSEVVAGIKGQPLVLAPGGEITAHLVAERASVGIGRGEAFGPKGSAVRNRFKRVNAVVPAVAGTFEFGRTEVEAVQRRA